MEGFRFSDLSGSPALAALLAKKYRKQEGDDAPPTPRGTRNEDGRGTNFGRGHAETEEGSRCARPDAELAPALHRNNANPSEPSSVPSPSPLQDSPTKATTPRHAVPSQAADNGRHNQRPRAETTLASKADQLGPYPFFYYRDYSQEPDPEPHEPLTPPGRVATFPAKLYAILSRPDLEDVIAWLPHGRAWRVLKPREFEQRVIPRYFEHAKFSSFIRQANGWGMRRISQGLDRGCYYHPLFLRGLPHLCKRMKRPGIAEKQAADPDHEPDFYEIAKLHPLPERTAQDATALALLANTLQRGPKARMPFSNPFSQSEKAGATSADPNARSPQEKDASSSSSATTAEKTSSSLPPDAAFQTAMKNSFQYVPFPLANPSTTSSGGVAATTAAASPSTASSNAINPLTLLADTTQHQPLHEVLSTRQENVPPPRPPSNTSSTAESGTNMPFGTTAPPNLQAALQASAEASQFAAGFAAAAALSHQQFQTMLESLATGRLPPATMVNSMSCIMNPQTIAQSFLAAQRQATTKQGSTN